MKGMVKHAWIGKSRKFSYTRPKGARGTEIRQDGDKGA
jgi:hypothetical protein